MKNDICFVVRGKYALFSDPVTRLGGEKFSYHLPTYEALKGIAKSVYWKPTIIWYVDRVRIMKPFRTQSKGVKPLRIGGGNDLSIYTYLVDVEYQVQAHFEFNLHRPELVQDRVAGKHYEIAKRMVARGGRQDIFLGTRECQGYVEPVSFGAGEGPYDDLGELSFGLMFHGFDYPDETGANEFQARFWQPVMRQGVVEFPRPEACELKKFIRPMQAKTFNPGQNFIGLAEEQMEQLLATPENPVDPNAHTLWPEG